MNYRIDNKYTTVLLLLFCSIIYSCAQTGYAGRQNADITNAIDSNNWVFTARLVRPQTGNNVPVNGLYTVEYVPGKLLVYLPYFGVSAGNADLLNNKSPLDFSTTTFTSEKTEVQNGKWDIVFKPGDQREIQSLNFTLFANGNADLYVVLTNRSPINYTGNITPYKKTKP